MGGWTIAWTNLAVLGGAAAILVPYAIHMLTRRTPRTIVFPTIQFLKRAQASQSALFRMRDLILLLVRTAFVALLLLSFLKPVLRARAMSDSVNRPRAAVIIADASLSMRYNAAGVTPFARAQTAIDSLLNHLGSDSAVNVIYAGVTATSSLDAPATSIVPLKRDLESAKPALARADLDTAVSEAIRQLEPFDDHARSIYLVSDFQRSNWSAVKFSGIPEDIRLIFLPVHDASASNVAVTDVVLRPRSPVVGESVEIVCTVSNFGPATAAVPLTLSLTRISRGDGDCSSDLQRTVEVAPGSSASAAFRLRATDKGVFEGVARVPGDSLPADDARFFTLDVVDQVDVLLVSDVATEPRSSAHFVWRALDPYAGDSDGARPGAMRVRTMRARDLDLDADPPHVLVLDGPGQLSAPVADSIAKYIASGGAAIYLLSDALDKGNIDAIARATAEAFVSPFALTSMNDRRGATGEDAASFGLADFDDPMLRRFKESRNLADPRFFRYFSTERAEGRGEVLLRFDDGTFALGKATLGAGALLLCNFSAGRDASDLAQRAAFLPLVNEMVKNMRPRESAASRSIVGGAASGTIAVNGATVGIAFTSPSGKTIGATTDRRGNHLTVLVSETTEPGFVRALEGANQLGAIPVNVDARESDLAALTEAQLNELAASPQRKLASASTQDSRAISSLLDGIPVWPYLLLGAMCVLGLEQALLAVLKR